VAAAALATVTTAARASPVVYVERPPERLARIESGLRLVTSSCGSAQDGDISIRLLGGVSVYVPLTWAPAGSRGERARSIARAMATGDAVRTLVASPARASSQIIHLLGS
jgi:hypothetical protein